MREAFEQVRPQIGACGIWCGSCAVGNGSLRELARRFGKVLDSHGVGGWAPPELDYPAFAAGLGTIRDIASCPGCRSFGGRSDCVMRACTTKRGIAECIGCTDPTACPHRETLEKMRTGARAAGLFVKTEEADPQALLVDWTAKLKTQWPSCILFLDDPSSTP